MKQESRELYLQGLKAGWPVGLGYFAVSAAFGMAAVIRGFTVREAVLISITNLTSAGQFAGITLIAQGAALTELVLMQVIINARYFLMSASAAQKCPKGMPLWQRMIMAFAMTDEVFAISVSRKGSLSFPWFLGLMTLPIAGWTAGTWCGAAAQGILPESLVSALGLALYGMFIAIIMPEARAKKPVLVCVLLAAFLSCLFAWVPALSGISSGYSVVVITIVVSALMASCAPVHQAETGSEDGGKEDRHV